MKALLLAAGLGTRLKPLTDNLPKALVEINGKTLLEIQIEKLSQAGFNDIIVNTHHFSQKVIDFLINNNFNATITISDESSELLDTGGGLKKAEWFFDDKPFLVYNVDVLSDLNLNKLINYHNRSSNLATLVVRNRNTMRYFLFNSENILCGWENKSTGEKIIKRQFDKITNLAFSGIQIINPSIFKLIKNKGKFSLTDLYLKLSGTENIGSYIDNDSLWMDMGSIDNLNKANEFFA